MGLLSWVVFGALAGWVASLVTGTNRRQGCLMDIVIGVVGALIGGFLVNLLGGDVSIGWDATSFVVAVGGAILLLLITGAARRRR